MQVEVVGVKFRNGNHIYSFLTNNLDIKVGDYVVVETEKGSDVARVVEEKKMVNPLNFSSPLKKIVQVASDEMMKKAKEYNENAGQLFKKVRQIVQAEKLEMKIVNVEASFDNSKYIINFTADGRVDFRELVKKLSSALKKKIELRQIGPRDEVRALGGFGACGKVCCCVEGVGDFDHVSIKMAKNQNLSLNPNSISGLCGKLMCCLAYENPVYLEALKLMPKVGSNVSTKDGNGVVIFNDLLKKEVDVKFVRGDDFEIKTYKVEEISFKKGE